MTVAMHVTAEKSEQPQHYGPDNPPASVPEADARRKQIIVEMMEIQTQLGTRNMTDADGNRVDGEKYWQWRQRAKWAWQARSREALYLKEWLRLQRDPVAPSAVGNERLLSRLERRAATVGVEPGDTMAILGEMYALCARLLRDDVPFTKSEREVLGLAFSTLKAAGYTPAQE